MAMTGPVGNTSIKAFRGSPASDADWTPMDFGFDVMRIKFIVKQGSTENLEVSLDGKDVAFVLPKPEADMNALQYDFEFNESSKNVWYVRKDGADIEVIATTS